MFSGVTRPDARQLSFGSCPRIIDPILLGDSVSITNHAFTVPASRLRFFAYFWTEAYLAGSKSYIFFFVLLVLRGCNDCVEVGDGFERERG